MTSSPLRVYLTAALAAVASGNACSSAADTSPSSTQAGTVASSPSQQAFTRLLSVMTSGYTEQATLVVRDEASLAAVWRTINNGIPGNPPPAVDLSTRMIIVLALGSRNTGGYGFAFDAMTLESGGAVVHYTTTAPGPGCMTTQVVTSPVDVVSVPRVNGQIRLDVRNVVQKC